MKIDFDLGAHGNTRVSAYAAGCVTVGAVVYAHSVVLAPGHDAKPWPPQRFSDLAAEHFEMLAALGPEIVLVGTGRRLLFPAAETLAPLTARRIGIEIMDTGAACRAYNFLLGEGRQVAAALLMIDE